VRERIYNNITYICISRAELIIVSFLLGFVGSITTIMLMSYFDRK